MSVEQINPQINPANLPFDELLKENRLYAVVGEFSSPDDLVNAARAARKAGYSKLEGYTPFPIHGLDEAIGEERSKLGYIVFLCGCTGFMFGLLLQWYTGGIDYPLLINGKPPFTMESSIPVIFESTVLFSAFGAVLGMLGLNGLPRLYHPVFKYQQYHRVTDDGFLLLVRQTDPQFNVPEITKFLKAQGARNTEPIEE